ncbi:MAG: cell division protein SepF [Micrococcales bacterium]|nr:cell division protein SepF [Micrococcales bacterium]
MAGSMRNAMRRLGLAPAESDEYVDYYEGSEQLADVTPISRGVGGYEAPMAESDAMHRIVTARPRGYNEAKTVGTPYREGVPVIMNLTDVVGEVDAQRLVDFAGGMTYALRGRLERITQRVFLLTPASVEISQVEAAPRRDFDSE